MSRITGLLEDPSGDVLIEVDGAAWRRVPVDAAARAGLTVGQVLERETLRTLRREVRRIGALSSAARALRERDLSIWQLDERLRIRGYADDERREALDALHQLGLTDDERLAGGRARSLAARAYGDEAIRWDLERRGVAAETSERAIAALEPETDRAHAAAHRRGRTPATARYLLRKGFSEAAVEFALAADIAADA